MTEKIRIKDIAQRAGVSVGTVDRVLHGRPNVSPSAREKVEKALSEMNYQPNVYASALAYNKSYTFYLVIPQHESETYWEEIEEGAKKAVETRRDFNLETKTLYYERLKEESFKKVAATNTQLDKSVHRSIARIEHPLRPARLVHARTESTLLFRTRLIQKRLLLGKDSDDGSPSRETNRSDEAHQGRNG